MKLLTQTKPQCLLYSLAMLLDETPEAIIKELGHDGMDVWWPEYDDQRRYRSHTMQEAQDVCITRGKALACIQACPTQAPDGRADIAKMTYEDNESRFLSILYCRPGMLIGESKGGGHACAWDGWNVYDPNGSIYDLNDFSIKECWLLTNLRLTSDKI